MDRIRCILGRDEQVLWYGEPRKGFALRSDDAFQIPFSFLWCGFVVFWLFEVPRKGPLFFYFWGAGFLALGLYMVFGRFLVDIYQRQQTVYGLTNQRVIILSKLLTEKTVSLPLTALGQIEVKQHLNGESSIFFGARTPHRKGFALDQRAKLEFVREGRPVYNMILEAQRRAAQ